MMQDRSSGILKLPVLLTRLVGIPSPYPFENTLAEWIGEYLVSFAFDVDFVEVEGRKSVVAIKGHGAALLLFGHLDTVPIQGVEEMNPHNADQRIQIVERAKLLGWKGDPYSPYIENGRLFGSGAIDMKAGVSAIIHTATQLPETWFDARQLILAFSIDEEFIDKGMVALLRSNKLRPALACICPEILDVGDRIHIPETPGVGTVLLGRRGRIPIYVDIIGQAAHGATPAAGINAIELAARVVAHVSHSITTGTLPLASHPILPKASMTPLQIHAGTSSLSIPDRCLIEFDRHFVPPETPEAILEDLSACIAQVLSPDQFRIRLKPRPTPYLLPFETPRNERIVQIIEKVLTARSIPISFTGGNSVADENLLASSSVVSELRHAIPTVVLGCKGGNFHKENEWVDLTSLALLGEIMFDVCMMW